MATDEAAGVATGTGEAPRGHGAADAQEWLRTARLWGSMRGWSHQALVTGAASLILGASQVAVRVRLGLRSRWGAGREGCCRPGPSPPPRIPITVHTGRCAGLLVGRVSAPVGLHHQVVSREPSGW